MTLGDREIQQVAVMRCVSPVQPTAILKALHGRLVVLSVHVELTEKKLDRADRRLVGGVVNVLVVDALLQCLQKGKVKKTVFYLAKKR